MLQPFELFNETALEKLITLGKTLLVTQTYTRGRKESEPAAMNCLLLTDYADMELASVHLKALSNDKFAALIQLDKPAHKTRLLQLLQQQEYRLYWNVVRSPEKLLKRIKTTYGQDIRHYITSHTNWGFSSKDPADATLEVIFGELFINVKWKTKRLKVKFEEIERSKNVL